MFHIFRQHKLACIGASLLFSLATHAQEIIFSDSAELFLPQLVSTVNADVKITFSPDGNKMLWGGIDWIAGKKDLDIWESDRVNGKWSIPRRAGFDSDSNDFDPFLSPDGKGVYFFSNRNGGFGKDDIYFSAFNASTQCFGDPVNVGNTINTPGSEWAPVTDGAGRYLFFASDGHGGAGGQDLFKAEITAGGFGKPVNLGPSVNSADDDFDAVLLPESALIFTSSRNKEQKADLYVSFMKGETLSPAQQLPAQINAADAWTFGPSANGKDPGYLYFSSHLRNNVGRTDIYRINYRVE